MPTYYNDEYNKIVNRCLAELASRTDISQMVPGAKARVILEIIARELGTAYATFSKDLLSTFVRYASGAQLDMIGELVGLARKPAGRNEVDAGEKVQQFYVYGGGTFGSINGDSGFTIPVGTKVFSRPITEDGKFLTFVLTEAVTCSSAATEVYASISAMEFGSVSNVGANSLVAHNFELYSDVANNTLRTRNIEAVTYAISEESDDSFRFRIMGQALKGEAANDTAIRLAALSIPGVADIKMSEYAYGIGTGAVYLKAITPTVSDRLIALVQREIDVAKGYGSYVTAKRPREVGVELDISLNLIKALSDAERADLTRRVQYRLYDFINSLDIGTALDTALLVRQVLMTDSNIKSTGTTTRPIDGLWIYKYSSAEDARVRQEAIGGYTAGEYDRIIVETSEMTDGLDPIVVRINA